MQWTLMEIEQRARELETQQRQNSQHRRELVLSRSKAEVEGLRFENQRLGATYDNQFEVFGDLPRKVTLFAENSR